MLFLEELALNDALVPKVTSQHKSESAFFYFDSIKLTLALKKFFTKHNVITTESFSVSTPKGTAANVAYFAPF